MSAFKSSQRLRNAGFRKVREERVPRLGTVRTYQRFIYRHGRWPEPIEEAILYPDGNVERWKIGERP